MMNDQNPAPETTHHPVSPALDEVRRAVEWTQADAERENSAFAEWFKDRGYPNYPDLYSLTTENAMHAAWQEAAKRTALRDRDME